MKVICIDDDFTKCKIEAVKNILKVGDNGCLPQKGQVYEVIGYVYWDEYDERKNVWAYILDGLESTESYGVKLSFNKKRFEVYDNTFVPNHISADGNIVRKVTMHCNFNIDVFFK